MKNFVLIVTIIYIQMKKIPTKYKKKQHFIYEKLKEKYGSDFFKYDVRIEWMFLNTRLVCGFLQIHTKYRM